PPATRFLHSFPTRRSSDLLGLLPGFQQGLFRPFWREGGNRMESIEVLDRIEGNTGTVGNRRIHVFQHALASLHFDAVSWGVVGLRSLSQYLFQTRQDASFDLARLTSAMIRKERIGKAPGTKGKNSAGILPSSIEISDNYQILE